MFLHRVDIRRVAYQIQAFRNTVDHQIRIAVQWCVNAGQLQHGKRDLVTDIVTIHIHTDRIKFTKREFFRAGMKRGFLAGLYVEALSSEIG